jgi:predicted DNA-binding transcriptional regulator YafY
MPSASAHHAVERQWHLLDILPSTAPGKTVIELTQSLADAGFKVDKRTTQRDLVSLASRFPICPSDALQPGWYWLNRKAFDTMGMTVSDAFTLHMLDRYLKAVMPVATTRQLKPLFELAKAKLDVEAESNDIAHWATLIAVAGAGLPVIAPEINQTILETIQNILFLRPREKLKIHYTKAGAKTAKEHIVDPVGLVQSGDKTYLVAMNPKFPEPATYALHRIDKAERTYERSTLPKGVSLQRFIDEGKIQFFSEGMIDLKARVSKMLGGQLAETKLSETQQLPEVEGGYELAVTLPNSLRLRQWLLSWAGHIEVLEPKALREDIARQLREGAARYD